MINNQIKIIKYEYKEVNEKYSIEFSGLNRCVLFHFIRFRPEFYLRSGEKWQ